MSTRLAFTSIVVGLVLATVQCAPQEGARNKPPPADPRKPNWWPQPPPEGGYPWPPPRPDGYDGELWPPLREVGDDPQLWVDFYGEAPDATQDERFKAPGHAGRTTFYKNFREINETDNRAPGCGMHVIRMFAGKFIETCDPYPEAVWRQICATVLDQKAAAERCRVVCQNNPEECRRDRLFVPPLNVNWSCVEGCTEPDAICPEDYANCTAHYLCDCWEN